MDSIARSTLAQMPDEVLAILFGFIVGPEPFLLSASCPVLRQRLTRSNIYNSHTSRLPINAIYAKNPTILLPLQSLVLHGQGPHSHSRFHIGMLPSTIKSLSMQFPDCYRRFIVLPEPTTGLEVNYPCDAQSVDSAQVVDFQTALPLLKSLSCDGVDIFIGHKLLARFPSTLTTLSLKAPALHDYSPCYSPVPPNLTELALESAELLRESLLSTASQLVSVRFGTAPISILPTLPPSIESLYLTTDEETKLSSIGALKKTNLKRLHLTAPVEHVRLFNDLSPSTLTDLKLSSSFHNTNGLPTLPSNLTQLYIKHMSYVDLNWDFLPPKLTKVSLYFYHDSFVGKPFPKSLPRSLKILLLDNILFSASSLPSGLDFTASFNVFVDEPNCLANLPTMAILGLQLPIEMAPPTAPWPLPPTSSLFVCPLPSKELLEAALPGRKYHSQKSPVRFDV